MKKLAFQEYQLALTQHLRAPKDTERPDGTSKKRVGIYAELVYNNLNSFLESAFPVLRQILKKKRWKQLTRNFLRDHRSHSPLFRDIPKAFLDYLATLSLAEQDLPPFTMELAHYEWLELAIDIHPQKVRWTKTRSIAKKACDKGLLKVNGKAAKASGEIKAGDLIDMKLYGFAWELKIKEVPTGNVAKKDAGDYYELLSREALATDTDLD